VGCEFTLLHELLEQLRALGVGLAGLLAAALRGGLLDVQLVQAVRQRQLQRVDDALGQAQALVLEQNVAHVVRRCRQSLRKSCSRRIACASGELRFRVDEAKEQWINRLHWHYVHINPQSISIGTELERFDICTRCSAIYQSSRALTFR
jgi:hypothetical protein